MLRCLRLRAPSPAPPPPRFRTWIRRLEVARAPRDRTNLWKIQLPSMGICTYPDLIFPRPSYLRPHCRAHQPRRGSARNCSARPVFDVAPCLPRGDSHARGRFEVHSSPDRGRAGIASGADNKGKRSCCVLRARCSSGAKNCVADNHPTGRSLELSEFRQSCNGILARREGL